MKAGEESGSLDEVAAELLRYYEMQSRLVRTFWGRVLLPIFQYVVAVVVIAGVFYIMGFLLSTLESKGHTVSIMDPKLILLLGYGGPIGIVVAYYFLTRVLGGTRLIHEMLLKLPVIGKVMRNLALARFSWTLKVMLRAAIPLTESLPQALAASGNAAFEARGEGMVSRLRDGLSIRESLEASRLFPHDYLEILSVAEESGSLEETFDRLAKNCFESAEFALKALAAVLAWLVWMCVAAVIITFVFIIFTRFYLGAFRAVGG